MYKFPIPDVNSSLSMWKSIERLFFQFTQAQEERTKRESITQVACEFPIFPCYSEKCGETGAQYWKEMEMRQAQLEWKSSGRFMLSFSHPSRRTKSILAYLELHKYCKKRREEMGIFNWKLFSSIIKIFSEGFYVTCMNGTLYFPQKSMNFTFSTWLSK